MDSTIRFHRLPDAPVNSEAWGDEVTPITEATEVIAVKGMGGHGSVQIPYRDLSAKGYVVKCASSDLMDLIYMHEHDLKKRGISYVEAANRIVAWLREELGKEGVLLPEKCEFARVRMEVDGAETPQELVVVIQSFIPNFVDEANHRTHQIPILGPRLDREFCETEEGKVLVDLDKIITALLQSHRKQLEALGILPKIPDKSS